MPTPSTCVPPSPLSHTHTSHSPSGSTPSSSQRAPTARTSGRSDPRAGCLRTRLSHLSCADGDCTDILAGHLGPTGCLIMSGALEAPCMPAATCTLTAGPWAACGSQWPWPPAVDRTGRGLGPYGGASSGPASLGAGVTSSCLKEARSHAQRFPERPEAPLAPAVLQRGRL